MKNVVEIVQEDSVAEKNQKEVIYKLIHGARRRVIFIAFLTSSLPAIVHTLNYFVVQAKIKFERDPTSTYVFWCAFFAE